MMALGIIESPEDEEGVEGIENDGVLSNIDPGGLIEPNFSLSSTEISLISVETTYSTLVNIKFSVKYCM